MNEEVIEYIDVLDKNGNKTGEVRSKADIHKEGLWHQTVHIWLLNSKGEILLQRRAKNKVDFPDVWDISVGGHIPSGEEPIDAAVREVKEEIGLDISPESLKFIGRVTQEHIQNNGMYLNNEFVNIYLLIKTDIDDINKLQLQKEEVQELRWIPMQELKQWVDQNRPDLYPHENEYKLIFEKLLR